MKKTFFYFVLILILFFSFRALDFFAFWILDLTKKENVVKLPVNTEFISVSSDYVYLTKSNSLGIRNPELPAKKKKRVLMLGDSFVFGIGVEEKDSMVRLVEEKLRSQGYDYELVNAGIIGYAPKDSLNLFRQLKDRIQPDVVVLCVFTNDVFESGKSIVWIKTRERIYRKTWVRVAGFVFPKTTEYLVQWQMASKAKALQTDADATFTAKVEYELKNKSKYKNKNHSEEETKALVDGFLLQLKDFGKFAGFRDENFEKWYTNIDKNIIKNAASGMVNSFYVLYGLIEPNYFKQSLDLTGEGEIRYQKLIEDIGTLREESKQHANEFLLVYVPSEFQFSREKLELGKNVGYSVEKRWLTGVSNLEKSLGDFSKTNSIPFLSLTETFRSKPKEKLVFDFDLHWNEKGNILAAEEISSFLIRNTKQSTSE
ncbi:hypothetical protein LPTSP3_g28710 [Leptospira kobayashii]|uniref:SGNH hydrolase-type esterase domain-containing protein n=1 Tax=Leptospira kobayashii TaxID=1917830 RepID=A0ABM7ULS3_9LEPT|nr:hypothetical protein [Leptospira kobayashii]BDA79941.1 hypothetical protein LPTSP3_g28710 [Leptospira kobayashii]